MRLLRQVSVDGGAAWQGVDAVPPARLFGDRVETGRVPLDRVFLPVLGLDDAVDVVPTDAKTVAARMVSSLEFERARLTVAYQQFRFAFPDRANPLLDTIRDRELALLTEALADLPAYEIRHPYPVPLHDLYAAADPYCQRKDHRVTRTLPRHAATCGAALLSLGLVACGTSTATPRVPATAPGGSAIATTPPAGTDGRARRGRGAPARLRLPRRGQRPAPTDPGTRSRPTPRPRERSRRR